MHQCVDFILFWNDTLHVSEGISAYHLEFKNVHTAASICQMDTAVRLLAGISASKQKAISVWLLYV